MVEMVFIGLSNGDFMNVSYGVEPDVWTKTVEPFMFGSPNRSLFGRSYKKFEPKLELSE